MLGFRYWGLDAEKNVMPMIKLKPEIANIIRNFHLGSVILFRYNLIDSAQTVNLISSLQQAHNNLPLFISVDQEGGYVTRLRDGTEMLGKYGIRLVQHAISNLVKLVGIIYGYELTQLGFNFNFVPVVDINNNQSNPIMACVLIQIGQN
ncbi:MAG: glycoside hydrolase family 3 N-terminal domain-containing protein [Arsenophonus endosymbiont of Dermacentor nuttalli]